jgi:hypothetical protein
MDYYIYNIDEYSEDTRQGNKFAPISPFRMGVFGSSDSGKTNMIINLLMGTKKLKENGERYILCNDVIVIAKHLNEPKWHIVKNFFNELAEEGEDVSFKILPATDIPDLSEYDPNRATVAIFEDPMHESKKIQERISEYFTSGRHSNVSPIYVSQRFFLTPKTIRENITYISLHRGAGSLADIKRIVSLYTERSDSIASIIDDLTRKKEFIIFDLRRSRDDPLSIRVRWDTSLQTVLDNLEKNQEYHNPVLDGSSMITQSTLLTNKSTDKISIDTKVVDESISSETFYKNKFNPWGQKILKDAKINGTLISIAKNMPSPSERKKLLAKGVHVKNSLIWAKYVYREAFNVKDKDLGPDWVKFEKLAK